MATRSTIGAAAIMNLSQSVISRQLGQLEAELGFDLFDRNRGRLVARPEALALLTQADQLSDIVVRVQRFAEELKAGSTGHGLLKIAVPHSLATTLLPRLVGTFLHDRPNVSLEILTGSYDALERMVAARDADLAFVRLPPESSGFDQRPLVSSDAVCIMPSGHPLAAQSIIRAGDLIGHEMVLLGRQRPIRLELDNVFRKSGIAVSCRLEAHSAASACALVGEGLGISVVTGFMAKLTGTPGIEIRPFEPALTNTYGVITLDDAPQSIIADQFVDHLERALHGIV